MVEHLIEAGVSKTSIDVFEPYREYEYQGIVKLRAEPLVHDAPNCGYHLEFPSGETAFYATDTATLSNISAKAYQYYFIERNYENEEIQKRMDAKRMNGEYSYEHRVLRNHLSEEQAMDWLAENMGPNSRYVFLHQSSNYGNKEI